ncbi:MAG TPA: OmpA family protein, partial [Acidobacteriaceae bacterium]|nr:OmpA family protein [Acidobacteriaceae bacterium]
KGSPAKPAVPAWSHWLWPKVDGATWVWTAYKVTPAEAHDGSPVVTFRRTFTSPTAGQGTLQITADNAFNVSLNGKLIGSQGPLDASSDQADLFTNLQTFQVPVLRGSNTLVIRAINYHRSDTHDPETNPGGLVYKLTGPPSLAATVAAGGKAEVYGIHFDTDKASIRPDSKPVLDEIAALLKSTPALKLEVSGHTDSTGDSAHNLQLSQARATAVVAALTTRYHIAASRLTAKGLGDTQPIASNSTDAGKAQNRRVELRSL